MAGNGKRRPMDELDGEIVADADEQGRWEVAYQEGECCDPPARSQFTVQEAIELGRKIAARRQ